MEKANMMVYVGEIKFYPSGAIETLFVGNGYFKDVLEEREEENRCLLDKAEKLGDKIKYIITQVYEIDPLAVPRKDIRTDLENIFDADQMGRFCYVTKKVLNLETDLGLNEDESLERFVLEEDEDESDSTFDDEEDIFINDDGNVRIEKRTSSVYEPYKEYYCCEGRTIRIEDDFDTGVGVNITITQDGVEIPHRVSAQNAENPKDVVALLARWGSFWVDASNDYVQSVLIECATLDGVPDTFLELENTEQLVIKGILCPDSDNNNILAHYNKWEDITV